jgi:hypothetical protein
MDAAVEQLVAALHQAPCRYILALTGGGTAAAGWLLSVPGGSRIVLEVAVPYAEEALCDYLGRRPESFCSVATSRDMARRAWERASYLAPGKQVAGAACTASLRSDRPKRGEHRLHVSTHDGLRTVTHSLTLTKGARSRQDEEEVAARVLLNALAEALGVEGRVPVPLLSGEEIIQEAHSPGDALTAFLLGQFPAVCVEPDGRARAGGPTPSVLLPGSFNPLHEGHCALAAVAARQVGAAAAFELTVVNADKPPLAEAEVRCRLAQFAWRAPVWLTRSPTFPEKAHLFPGATFVVGADTAARVVSPRFYQDSEERMAEALAEFRRQGGRFLVAGRVDLAGRFLGLDDLDMPAAYRDLFTAILATEFRFDISSTHLRAQTGPDRVPEEPG